MIVEAIKPERHAVVQRVQNGRVENLRYLKALVKVWSATRHPAGFAKRTENAHARNTRASASGRFAPTSEPPGVFFAQSIVRIIIVEYGLALLRSGANASSKD